MAETVPDFTTSERYEDEAIDVEALERDFARPAFQRPLGRTAFERLAAESPAWTRESAAYTMLKSTPREGKQPDQDEDDR